MVITVDTVAAVGLRAWELLAAGLLHDATIIVLGLGSILVGLDRRPRSRITMCAG